MGAGWQTTYESCKRGATLSLVTLQGKVEGTRRVLDQVR